MASAGDMHTFVQTTIPKALADLMDSNKNIIQIATYCKSAYVSGDQTKVYEQTREYTKECILNVAYHVQTIGTHISTLLDLQTSEIDKLDIQIRALTDRVKACHEAAGATGLHVKEANKVYEKTSKVRKLEGGEIPETAKAPRKYQRQPINYSSIESGTMTSSSSFTPTPPPPTTATSSPGYFNQRQSIALGAPPSLMAPPSFSAPPPSFSAPPPPPISSSSSSGQSFNTVPSFNNNPPSLGGPPPPPPSSLPPPPPPSFGDFPPPPPPDFDFDFMPPPPPAFDDGMPPPPPLDFGAPPAFGLPPPLPPR